MPRFAACGPAYGWVRSPYVIVYFFFCLIAYSRGGFLSGRPDVFPGRDVVGLVESKTVRLPFCVQVPRSPLFSGRPDGFSRARFSVSSRFPCPRCARSSGMWKWITSSSTKCCGVSAF